MGDLFGAAKRPAGDLRKSDILYLTLPAKPSVTARMSSRCLILLQLDQHLHGLLNRRLAVHTVHIVEVDVVGL